VLINRLLMPCARRHFEARHKPEAPECWRHLNQPIWPEVCITHLKACKQVLANNNSKTKRSNFAKVTSRLTFRHISLSQKEIYKMKMIPIEMMENNANRTGNNNWRLCELCVRLAQVTSEHLTFLFPTFESGIRCSRNDGPPVIWISSLCL